MEIKDIQEIYDYFDVDPIDSVLEKPLKRAIRQEKISIDDDSESICFKIKNEVRVVTAHSATKTNVLKFTELTGGDRRKLTTSPEEKMAEVTDRVIRTNCGVHLEDFDKKVTSKETAVMQAIFNIFF